MVHTSFSCSCSPWFIRFLTFAAITSAFVMSILALESCELVEGTVINYDIPKEDITFKDLQRANATDLSLPPLPDDLLDASRNRPDGADYETFTLGTFRAKESGSALPSWSSKCLHYGNGYSKEYMNAGAVEIISRICGSLAAFLGGISMVAFFALMATEPTRKLFLKIFTGILIAAAVFQVLIFVLFASAHCGESFWNDFLSKRDQLIDETHGVSCSMGDGGWYALIGFILYLFSAGLVSLKWFTPHFSVFGMEWTKVYNDGEQVPLAVKTHPDHEEYYDDQA